MRPTENIMKKSKTKTSMKDKMAVYLRAEKEAMSKLEWKPIGIAAMDTACLLISDPCYSLPYTTESEAKSFEITSAKAVYDTMGEGGEHGQVMFKRGHEGAGVVVHSPCGDGTVEVWAKIDGRGRVRAVFFSFDGESPE